MEEAEKRSVPPYTYGIDKLCLCLPGSWIRCLCVRPPVSSIQCTEMHAYNNKMFIVIYIKVLYLLLLQIYVLDTKIWPMLKRWLYLWYLQYQLFSKISLMKFLMPWHVSSPKFNQNRRIVSLMSLCYIDSS